MEEQPLGVAISVAGNRIRLTYKQWAHIVESHDYMAGNMGIALETLAGPEIVIEGDGGASIALRHYPHTNITKKTAVVIYRDEPDGFVITAFFTSRPDKVRKRRRILWKRQ